MYNWLYKTPDDFDDMIMNSDGEYLTGLYFIGSKDAEKHITDCQKQELPIFQETCKWLDLYFSGKNPNFIPKYRIENVTTFRKEVLDIMSDIPFGKTITYNDISKIIAKKRRIKRMSSQAVGGAVGWNPICIIIPCHRVVGSNGNLTGYGGGMQNKISLLKLEQNDMSDFFVPKKV